MTERWLVRSPNYAMVFQPSLRLCLVDPAESDWLPFVELAGLGRLDLHQVTNGRSALRIDPDCIDAWMINVRLPDMTGFDLHQMLIERLPSPFVALVDERYSDLHERRARTSGAKLYICKPPQIWWLDLLAHPPPQ